MNGIPTVLRHIHDESWDELKTYLTSTKADLRKSDARGWTILHHAVWFNCPPEIARIIIQIIGISPNEPDGRGNTSMHDAAYQNVSTELLITLLQNGGNPNKANNFGETAVYEAAYRASHVLMRTLLEYGGDPNIQAGEELTTPLSVALQAKASIETLALLLKYHANPKIQDIYCNDAFAVAKIHIPGLIFLQKIQTMLLLYSTVTIPRLKRRSSLRCLPPELLRLIHEML